MAEVTTTLSFAPDGNRTAWEVQSKVADGKVFVRVNNNSYGSWCELSQLLTVLERVGVEAHILQPALNPTLDLGARLEARKIEAEKTAI